MKVPRALRRFYDNLDSRITAGRVRPGAGTSISETPYGTAVNVSGLPDLASSAGSGGGGADNLETVTGAVNGVPSTLEVQTDGNGWTAI